jgi:hypothetical protein
VLKHLILKKVWKTIQIIRNRLNNIRIVFVFRWSSYNILFLFDSLLLDIVNCETARVGTWIPAAWSWICARWYFFRCSLVKYEPSSLCRWIRIFSFSFLFSRCSFSKRNFSSSFWLRSSCKRWCFFASSSASNSAFSRSIWRCFIKFI